MAIELTVPKLGLTMTSGTVTEWVAAAGASVKEGDVVYLLTTDKTDTEVEAEGAGALHPAVEAGTVVKPGAVIGWLLEPGEEPPTSEGAAAEPAEGATGASTGTGSPTTAAPTAPARPDSGERIVASPYAKRRAAELSVELSTVRGTGPGGRIIAEDVEGAAQAPTTAAAMATSATPAGTSDGAAAAVRSTTLAGRLADRLGLDLADVAGTGPGGRVRVDDVIAAAGQGPVAPSSRTEPEGPAMGDRVPMSTMRNVIAERMTASLQESAQLTLHTEVEADALKRFRAELKSSWDDSAGPVPSYTDLVVKAVALALPRHPLLNSSLVGNEIHVHDVVDVGVAVAVPDGLVVPVVRSADELPLGALASLSSALAAKAKDGGLAPSEVEASTFTVSALGSFGIDAFTPILNAPNAGILGVGRLRESVAWVDGVATPSSVMGLSLTIDHRVVDGAPGAAFLAEVAQLLAAPLRLVV